MNEADIPGLGARPPSPPLASLSRPTPPTPRQSLLSVPRIGWTARLAPGSMSYSSGAPSRVRLDRPSPALLRVALLGALVLGVLVQTAQAAASALPLSKTKTMCVPLASPSRLLLPY